MSKTIFDGEVKKIKNIKPKKEKVRPAIKDAAEKAFKGIKEERFAFGDQRTNYEKNLAIIKENPLIAWIDNPWMDSDKPETIKEKHHYATLFFTPGADDIFIRFLHSKERSFMFIMRDREAVVELKQRLDSLSSHLHTLLKTIS